MALGNFQSLIIKKETTAGTPVKPTKSLRIEGASVNSKVNTRAISQIEGKTFSPSKLVKSTIETSGTIDVFIDRENFPFFMAMLTAVPTPTNNADGTYTWTFDVEGAYGLPPFTFEVAKDFYTERDTGVVGTKLDLSVDTETIKGSLEVMGLKALTSYRITAKSTDTLTLDGDVSLFLASDTVSKNGALTSSGTIGSVSTVNSTITLGTGEGSAFSVGDVVSLVKQTPSYTSGVTPFRYFEKTAVKFADSIANLVSATATPVGELGVTIANSNEGLYLSGSNFASQIRQGNRTMEGKLMIPSESAFREFTAYQALEQRAIQIVLTGETIGSGSRKEQITIQGLIQYKEGPVDIKADAFIDVSFGFDFVGSVTVSCVTTIATI